ncbi:M64 family metallopeptidase [Undibacterium terreum]|uniref:DUF4214 domain-containing protein n=1 Tax=Undibacterium terreum TaxID=1224302 RepID=A0A916UZU9_9BURK|nr:M64 family metallopeptidase [Undibacterium terreum]GGC96317.1 hypothetical protein GCM10011396_49650 [Undibacterium terreum]
MADLTTLLNTGSSAQRVDIVFVAEGYTAAEKAKFLADANSYLNSILGSANGVLNAPFSNYKNFFNASALFVASEQSGTDQPNNNVAVNTYFNATQHGSDGRLLYGDERKVQDYVAQSTSANAHELTIVLVNTKLYGGAGGSVAWAAAGNSQASEIVLHEIGHSFAGLQDEYVDASVASQFSMSDYGFTHSPHVSASPTNVPWSAWLGYKDGLGTVGAYEGGYYRATGVWRATLDSKMNHLGVAFSAPEKEAFALAYYHAIGDYLTMSSDIPGLYKISTPDDSLFSFDWKINGNSVKNTNGDYFDAYAAGGTSGATVSLTTSDITGYIRQHLADTQQSEQSSLSAQTLTPAGANYSVAASNSMLRMDGSNNLISIDAPQSAMGIYVDGGAGSDTLQFNAKLGDLASATAYLGKLASGTVLIGGKDTPHWAATNVEKLQFSDYTVNLGVQADAHSISTAQLHSLEELYVAYFNRMPDADGLDYWITQLKGGMSIKQIGDAFYSAATQFPAQTGFTDSLSNADFVNLIYKNTLGRPQGADQTGLDYWVGNLVSGAYTHGSLVAAILSGAHTYKGDATWGWVANLLDNKVTVADKFAVEWGLGYLTPEASIVNGMAIAGAVTATDIQAAIKLIGIADGQIHLA